MDEIWELIFVIGVVCWVGYLLLGWDFRDFVQLGFAIVFGRSIGHLFFR